MSTYEIANQMFFRGIGLMALWFTLVVVHQYLHFRQPKECGYEVYQNFGTLWASRLFTIIVVFSRFLLIIGGLMVICGGAGRH